MLAFLGEDIDSEAISLAFPDLDEPDLLRLLERLNYLHGGSLTVKGSFLLKKRWQRPYAYELRGGFPDYYYLEKPFSSPLGCVLSMKELSRKAGLFEDRSTLTSEIRPNVSEGTLKMAISFFLIHLNPDKGSIAYRVMDDGILFEFPTRTVPADLRTVPADLFRMGVLEESPFPHWKRCESNSEIRRFVSYGAYRCFFPFGATLINEGPFQDSSFGEMEGRIVDLLRRNGKIDRKTIVKETGINSGLAGYYLSSLQRKGVITMVGSPRAKGSFYVPAKRKPML